MIRKLLLVTILIFTVAGCSAQKTEVIQTPKFTIVVDVRNDAVAGVVNSSELSLGTVFLARNNTWVFNVFS